MDWVEHFSSSAIRGIDEVKVLAAVRLILSALCDTATFLIPLAARSRSSPLSESTRTASTRAGKHSESNSVPRLLDCLGDWSHIATWEIGGRACHSAIEICAQCLVRPFQLAYSHQTTIRYCTSCLGDRTLLSNSRLDCRMYWEHLGSRDCSDIRATEGR